MTVQGSALSPGVSAPSGIHLPSKRRCPKDLYKFACRILADILTSGRCGGWPVASVVARYVSAAASLKMTALPNFILTRSRSSAHFTRNSRSYGNESSHLPLVLSHVLETN